MKKETHQQGATAMTENAKTSKTPSHHVYMVEETKQKKSFWTKIGRLLDKALFLDEVYFIHGRLALFECIKLRW